MNNFSPVLRGLYIVTDKRAPKGHIAMARSALAGGAKIIQLRDKTTTREETLRNAQALRTLTRQHNALLLINDDIELARQCQADGVHLGPDDMPVPQARLLLPNSVIGASCGTLEEAQSALRHGATYIGVGAVFGTQTKLDAGTPIGLNNLRRIVRATALPVAAIGGIDGGNIADVVSRGAHMACVVSAISSQPDEEAMQRATRELIEAARFSPFEYSNL